MKELIERLREGTAANGPYEPAYTVPATKLNREAADALERLTAELADVTSMYNRLVDDVHAARAERDALRADAMRYRWLRDGLSGPLAATDGMKRMAGAFGEFDDTPSAEQFDAAIDAAIGGEKK